MANVELDESIEKDLSRPKGGSILRAVLIGLALIPITVFWLLYMEVVTN